jgi:hypothetical protein
MTSTHTYNRRIYTSLAEMLRVSIGACFSNSWDRRIFIER